MLKVADLVKINKSLRMLLCMVMVVMLCAQHLLSPPYILMCYYKCKVSYSPVSSGWGVPKIITRSRGELESWIILIMIKTQVKIVTVV